MLSKTHSKYIQSLHHKKTRDAEAVFIAEGNKVVTELIQADQFLCREIWATATWADKNHITLSPDYAEKLQVVTDIELEKISALQTPNEVFAIFEQQPGYGFQPEGQLTLMLDTIQDPGNLGTIIRIADWFGIKNLVCSTNTADCYNPKVVQSTMGSIARVNILYTNLLEWLQQHEQIATYAAALHGAALSGFTPIQEGVIIIGNESKGLSAELLTIAKQRITIPKFGKAESLNAAVATGIILSHLKGA